MAGGQTWVWVLRHAKSSVRPYRRSNRSTGAIFRATNLHTNQVAALKLQPTDVDCPTNRYERYFYPALQGGLGMPILWAAGVEGQFDWLAIELLGPSIDSLFRRSGKNVMDLRSVCCIAMQVVSASSSSASWGLSRPWLSTSPSLYHPCVTPKDIAPRDHARAWRPPQRHPTRELCHWLAAQRPADLHD